MVSNAIPIGTQVIGAPAPTAPAGYTVVYTTTAITTAPSAAVWTTAAPPLATVTRIGFFNNGGSLTAGSTTGPFTFTVVITTTDATTPIGTIADVFGVNFVVANITDQSGDAVPNVGDVCVGGRRCDRADDPTLGNSGRGHAAHPVRLSELDLLLAAAAAPPGLCHRSPLLRSGWSIAAVPSVL